MSVVTRTGRIGFIIILLVLKASSGWASIITVEGFTSAAIQTAIDSAGTGDTIYLPAGNYDFTTQVNVAKSLTIQGQGRLKDVGVVEPGVANEDPAWWNGVSRCYTTNPDLVFFRVQSDNVGFIGIKIEGAVTHSTGSGDGIYSPSTGGSTGYDGLIVEGCELLHHAYAVHFNNVRGGRFHGCYSHHNNRDGLGYGVAATGSGGFSGGSEVIVTGNEFSFNRHDLASNGPETKIMFVDNYCRDNDLSQNQPSVESHPEGGETFRLVVRDNVFENTRPIAVRTGSLEITGNYFDLRCSDWWPYRPIYINNPQASGGVFCPEALLHDIYIGENTNDTGTPLVYVAVYDYSPQKWVAYNLYTDGELYEATHTTYPPRDTDPVPLVGNIYFTEVNGSMKVETLRADTWYDLHLMACDPQGWVNIAEVGIQIVDTENYSYTTNMVNTGNFSADGNYFIKSDGTHLFAREIQETDSWKSLTGTVGSYVDGTSWSWVASGAHRLHFKVRVKVPVGTTSGAWKMHGYVRDDNGNHPVDNGYENQEGWYIAAIADSWIDPNVVFNDTFGVGAAPTIGDDADDPTDAEWGILGSGQMLAVVDDGGNNAMGVTATSQYRGAKTLLPSVVTLAAGDSISLGFKVRAASTPVDLYQGFSFSFYNSDGTGTGEYGYVFGLPWGTESAAKINESSNTGVLSAGTTVDWESTAAGLLSEIGWHTVVATIKRVDSDTLSFSCSVDGTHVWSDYQYSDPVLTTTFDMIAIGNRATTQSFMLDDIEESVMRHEQTTSNGTSYAWLDLYFSGLVTSNDYETAGNGNPDGDSLLTWEEYIAGTIPTNSASYFDFQYPGTRFVPTGLQLQWNGIGGRTYRVEMGTNMMDNPAFTTLKSGIEGEDGTMGFVDTNANERVQAFYRIYVE